MERVAERFQAEREYWQARIAPIRKHAKVDDHYITGADEHRMFDPPTDSERHAARRLGVEVPILKCTALTFFDHRDFDEERDRRVGNVDELAPRSRQARRGLVTREMLAELDTLLDKAGVDRKKDADGER